MQIRQLLYSSLAAILMLASCKKGDMAPDSASEVAPVTTSSYRTQAVTQTFAEGFEASNKTAYAAASVTLNSGS